MARQVVHRLLILWCIGTALLPDIASAACTAGACHLIHAHPTSVAPKHQRFAQKAVMTARTLPPSASVALFVGALTADRVVRTTLASPRMTRLRHRWGMFHNEDDRVSNKNDNVDDAEASTAHDGESNKDKEEEDEPAMSTAMVASIGFYKKFISPILPPACRFLPTCSQYGVQAIQEFGPSKGAILIAWRLLRCSPIGGKGYDPPRWPPVPFTYSSY